MLNQLETLQLLAAIEDLIILARGPRDGERRNPIEAAHVIGRAEGLLAANRARIQPMGAELIAGLAGALGGNVEVRTGHLSIGPNGETGGHSEVVTPCVE